MCIITGTVKSMPQPWLLILAHINPSQIHCYMREQDFPIYEYLNNISRFQLKSRTLFWFLVQKLEHMVFFPDNQDKQSERTPVSQTNTSSRTQPKNSLTFHSHRKYGPLWTACTHPMANLPMSSMNGDWYTILFVCEETAFKLWNTLSTCVPNDYIPVVFLSSTPHHLK